MPIQMAALTSGRSISDAQYARWLESERIYLESKQSEPESDVLGVEYVEMLEKYHSARDLFQLRLRQRLALNLACRNLWEASKGVAAVTAKHKARLRQVTNDAWEGVLFLQNELQKLEGELDLGARWTTDSAEYKHAHVYIRTRSYQRAVDKLEGLVVQQLFELTKANTLQTGM